MLARTEMTLRTAAIGCRLQPSINSPCTYHTTALSLRSKKTESTATRKPSLKPSSPSSSPLRISSIVRYSSTAPAPTSSSSTSSPISSASTQSPLGRLDWNTFFQLRKSRRRLQLGCSIGSGIICMAGGAQLIMTTDLDSIVGQVPLDPVITLGLMTFACGGLGWLLGPIVGTGMFNMMNRKYVTQMAMKEKEFYSRIKKYRVDPSSSSVANPVPDYYGEKISSIQGYRRWLKDQRAFNKKKSVGGLLFST